MAHALDYVALFPALLFVFLQVHLQLLGTVQMLKQRDGQAGDVCFVEKEEEVVSAVL